jgi:hypothetical protein
MRWFRLDRVASARLSDGSAARRDPATFGAPPAGDRPVGDHPNHPAGRALRRRAAEQRPRLVVLPGGRAD